MQMQNLNRLLAGAVICFLTFLLLTDCSAPPQALIIESLDEAPRFKFFEDFEGWIEEGYEKYGEFKLNGSLTAEVVVGEGEEYTGIQEALDAGYTCIYLKRQVFNVTSPIKPPKENFYILGDGAEIVAAKPMTAVFDIRDLRYAHFDGLFINGNGLAQKCIDASRAPGQVPVHQIRNCKVWGAVHANIDFTGCEDSLIFNCWVDGRNDVGEPPLAIAEYGLKIGEFCDGYKTGGQINLIHCLFGFHRRADVFAKDVAQLKFANCLLSSKNMWSSEFEAHIIVECGNGESALPPTLELMNCWVENGLGGNVPNILVRNGMMSRLTVVGGMFYTDSSPNIYSPLNPCAEAITLVGALFGALFEHNKKYDGYNVVAAAQNLVSVGNVYNWHGIDKANVTSYLIFDEGCGEIETKEGARLIA